MTSNDIIKHRSEELNVFVFTWWDTNFLFVYILFALLTDFSFTLFLTVKHLLALCLQSALMNKAHCLAVVLLCCCCCCKDTNKVLQTGLIPV